MLTIAERFRDILIPFLVVGTAALLLLLFVLILQRLLRAAAAARRRALDARYAPVVDAVLAEETAADGRAALARVRRRHRPIVGALLLAPLRVARGGISERARAAADDLDLRNDWLADLRARRWWVRAEAAIALGLLRDTDAVPALIETLEDEHAQVRAAAIDALGAIGDSTAAPALLARMADESRHERPRLIEALRALGPDVTPALVAHAQAIPPHRALVAEVLSYVGSAAARDSLIAWAVDGEPGARAAAWRALASIGVDERAFYHALRALGDASEVVRAAAALALGRTGRGDAVPYLAARLDDVWDVAAESARALARLGAPGVDALRARAEGAPGLGLDLARQLVWESERR